MLGSRSFRKPKPDLLYICGIELDKIVHFFHLRTVISVGERGIILRSLMDRLIVFITSRYKVAD